MTSRETVCNALDCMGIAYTLITHSAVFTIDDCLTIPGIDWRTTEIPRNAFLSNRQQTAFYLMLLRHDTPFRTAIVSKALGVSRLSFGKEDLLPQLLGLHPGAVSPLGLLFDEKAQVQLVIDNDLATFENLAFHPCDNTATLVMHRTDFTDVFLHKINRTPIWVQAKEVLPQ